MSFEFFVVIYTSNHCLIQFTSKVVIEEMPKSKNSRNLPMKPQNIFFIKRLQAFSHFFIQGFFFEDFWKMNFWEKINLLLGNKPKKITSVAKEESVWKLVIVVVRSCVRGWVRERVPVWKCEWVQVCVGVHVSVCVCGFVRANAKSPHCKLVLAWRLNFIQQCLKSSSMPCWTNLCQNYEVKQNYKSGSHYSKGALRYHHNKKCWFVFHGKSKTLLQMLMILFQTQTPDFRCSVKCSVNTSPHIN